MAYNLIVAYDLIAPGQNYEAVTTKIKSLGTWEKLQFSLFYLHTAYAPGQVFDAVHSVMDAGDKLAVVNAFGAVVTESKQVCDAINYFWLGKVAA